jgi:hypothetical protein
MIIEPTKPKPIPFGILQKYRKTTYGHYMIGEYKGNKIEIYDAKAHNQKLQYVSNSKTLKWIKSKLTYIQDGIRKIMRSEAR